MELRLDLSAWSSGWTIADMTSVNGVINERLELAADDKMMSSGLATLTNKHPKRWRWAYRISYCTYSYNVIVNKSGVGKCKYVEHKTQAS
jgi:hypothetical protein